LDDKKDHTVQISSELPENLESELVSFLRKNADLFAWTPANMPGIDPGFLCHKLMIDPKIKPFPRKKKTGRRTQEDREAGVRGTTESRFHQGDPVHHMVGERCYGEEG
jgi:hypothetical protein